MVVPSSWSILRMDPPIPSRLSVLSTTTAQPALKAVLSESPSPEQRQDSIPYRRADAFSGRGQNPCNLLFTRWRQLKMLSFQFAFIIGECSLHPHIPLDLQSITLFWKEWLVPNGSTPSLNCFPIELSIEIVKFTASIS